MNGFVFILTNSFDLRNLALEDDFHVVNNRDKYYCNKELFVYASGSVKFPEDNIFAIRDDFLLITNGVLLNNIDLTKKYRCNNLTEAIEQCYVKNELDTLINEMRGSFSGILYDRKREVVYSFVDHFATKTLFYYKLEDGLIIASEVYTIVNILKTMGEQVTLDEIGAYSLLSNGYMFGDHSLVRGIRRLREGTIYKYTANEIEPIVYHEIIFTEHDISLDEAIEKVDQLFRNAVYLQHKKNIEHGYIDVVPLSAGLDCRMTSFVLNAMTNETILNFTYSETGQYDAIVPAEMAKIQKNKWIFKSLDNGLDMLNIEKGIELSDSLIKYDWPAQLLDFLEIVDTSNWGIVHTGVIGDVILGSFEKSPAMHRGYLVGDGAFSKKLIGKLKSRIEAENEIPNMLFEKGMIINRGINGACLGYSRTFRFVAEDLSPFMNVDFADFCFSLPLSLRRGHHLYYEWVKKKYPRAAAFKHNGISFSGNVTFNFKGRKYYLRSLPDLMINKIKRDIIKKGYGMNPQDTWYQNNEDLRFRMDNYFFSTIGMLNISKELLEDARNLYENGNTIDKVLAISLVGSCKKLFD